MKIRPNKTLQPTLAATRYFFTTVFPFLPPPAQPQPAFGAAELGVSPFMKSFVTFTFLAFVLVASAIGLTDDTLPKTPGVYKSGPWSYTYAIASPGTRSEGRT